MRFAKRFADYTALSEGAYLLHSPANARRLVEAYESALNGMRRAEVSPPSPPDATQRRG